MSISTYLRRTRIREYLHNTYGTDKSEDWRAGYEACLCAETDLTFFQSNGPWSLGWIDAWIIVQAEMYARRCSLEEQAAWTRYIEWARRTGLVL